MQPAAVDAASNPSFYLQPAEVALLVDTYRPEHIARFGGVALWDAARSEDTPVNGMPYANAIKDILTAGSSSNNPALSPAPPSTTAASISSTVAFSTRTAARSTMMTQTFAHTLHTSSTHISTLSAVSSPRACPATASSSTAPSSRASSSATSSSTAAATGPSPPLQHPTCPSTSVPCGVPGIIICVGVNQFGLCDINYCAIPQALAAGTACTDGQIGYPPGYPVAAALDQKDKRDVDHVSSPAVLQLKDRNILSGF